MKPSLVLIGSLSAVLLTGCFRTVIDTPAASAGREREEAGVSWLALTSTTTNARECTYGVAKAETYMPVWGVFAYWATAGIVAPMKTLYICAAPPSPGTGGQ